MSLPEAVAAMLGTMRAVGPVGKLGALKAQLADPLAEVSGLTQYPSSLSENLDDGPRRLAY